MSFNKKVLFLVFSTLLLFLSTFSLASSDASNPFIAWKIIAVLVNTFNVFIWAKIIHAK